MENRKEASRGKRFNVGRQVGFWGQEGELISNAENHATPTLVSARKGVEYAYSLFGGTQESTHTTQVFSTWRGRIFLEAPPAK